VGTPDPDFNGGSYGPGQRWARVLPPGSRCAMHWDNGGLPLELVVRPTGALLLPALQGTFGVVGPL
jgi:hypothetical protein